MANNDTKTDTAVEPDTSPASPSKPDSPTPTATTTTTTTTAAEPVEHDAASTSDDAPTSSSPPPTSSSDKPPEPPAKDDPPPPQPEPPLIPAKRRPKPPTKGILKPPPPPVKPTLGNRLRDMVVGSVTGEAPGPSQPLGGSNAVNAAVGTLNAISGRLGLGFSRFVANHAGSDLAQAAPPPRGPLPPRSTAPLQQHDGLPQLVAQPPVIEYARPSQPLKRATFVLPSISITYPISSRGEPFSRKVLQEREQVETRQRTLLTAAKGAEYWTSMRLIKLYESACRGREEKPRIAIVKALQAIPQAPRPRIIHLVLRDVPNQPYPSPYPLEHPLTRYAAEALADVLAVEWSLSDLRLEGGVIEREDVLKPILHALLVSGTLPSLSLAGNKRIRPEGWRLLAVFLKRARSIKFVDLSDTTWDRKSIEYLVYALNSAPVQSPPLEMPHRPDAPAEGDQADTANGSAEATQDPSTRYGMFLPSTPFLKDDGTQTQPAAVQSLRLDGCNLRSGTLDGLAHGIRTSELRHLSLRRNRISPLGAVALAVMIRDYPDTASMTFGSGSSDSTLQLPYAPRSRRPSPEPPAEDPNLPPIPLVVSSSAGGVTSRVVPEGYKAPPPPKHPLVMPGGGYSAIQDSAGFGLSSAPVEGKIIGSELGGASLALQRSVRALDGVERIGNLVTLDLKGNEIRTGVSYIAQVLKRNRTLKVLNLSDNKLEPSGLVALAEALKYNSTLETLDVSSNPCSGPALEGIAALRTSFTVNHSLKRLFLTDTGLTTEGAIDLAEFIPENRSLLHLDLTNNPSIGTAGILAVSSGLKSNRIIRCLDISIPPNDGDLAELSQIILQSCIRNTELAAAASKEVKHTRVAQEAIWGPIKKSTLVRQVKEADAARAQKEREQVVKSVEGVAREYVYRLKPESLVPATNDTIRGLEQWYEAGRAARTSPMSVWENNRMPREDFRSLVERGRALTERLAETVEQTSDSEKLEKLLGLNDKLTGLVASAKGFTPPPRILLPSQIAFAAPAAPVVTSTPTHLTPRRRHQRNSNSLEISSPNFSIGDSDAESDAEELDAQSIVPAVVSPASTPTKPKPAKKDGAAKPPPLKPTNVSNNSAPAAERENGIGSSNSSSDDLTPAADQLVDAELNQGRDPASPVERASRKWVEEEGEIFRKGTRLGVVDGESESESDEESAGKAQSHKPAKTGEELRQEILEAEVPRSPPRQVVDMTAEVEGDGDEARGNDS
ncbi:hypothetical protein Q8F55_006905 [Vanrija albida]|uniref:RNI-like protein n=1 Tax=Vanrija albida TaxID=181172 RepID=A0ABR3PYL6_9TREE